MSGTSVLGLLSTLLLLTYGCGGRSLASSSGAAAGDAAVNGGASNTAEECLGGAPVGGCGGEGGEGALEDYARLRAACSDGARVNRHGTLVPVCFRIR